MANPQAEYTRRMLQSRKVRDKIVEKQTDEIRKLLKELDTEIDSLLTDGSLKSYASWQRKGVQDSLRSAASAFGDSLEANIGNAGNDIIEQTLAIRTAATEELIASVSGGDPNAAAPAVAAINTISIEAVKATVARMYPDGLLLSDRIWTLTREAVAAINRIVLRGIIIGESHQSIAMKLRAYIRAAEALTPKQLLDLRHLPRVATEKRIAEIMAEREIGRDAAYKIAQAEVEQMRQLGRNIAYRARSMAASEINASAHEAHIASAAKSPVVKAQEWNLSNRHIVYDECDPLATANYYGLGPGVYPIGKTPHRAHTNCRCYVTDVLRPIEEWEKPKPNPDLKRDPLKTRYRFALGMTAKQKQRVRKNAANLVNSVERASSAQAV